VRGDALLQNWNVSSIAAERSARRRISSSRSILTRLSSDWPVDHHRDVALENHAR
jgi:hypothetical protein